MSIVFCTHFEYFQQTSQQAVFHPREKLRLVYELVRSSLADPAAAFTFLLPPAPSPLDDETKTLEALGMSPAAVLRLKWTEPNAVSLVKKELLDAVVPLAPVEMPEAVPVWKPEEVDKKKEKKMPAFMAAKQVLLYLTLMSTIHLCCNDSLIIPHSS